MELLIQLTAQYVIQMMMLTFVLVHIFLTRLHLDVKEELMFKV